MYVRSVRIERVRCFDDVDLTFRYPGDGARVWHPNITVLLGDNGAGKTTALRAIVISILGKLLPDSGYYSYEIVRRNIAGGRRRFAAISGHLALHGWDIAQESSSLRNDFVATVATIEHIGDFESTRWNLLGDSADSVAQLVQSRFDRTLYKERSPSFFLAAYGAQRTLTRRESDSYSLTFKRLPARYRRVAGLFDESIPLIPLSTWLSPLRKTQGGRFREIVKVINALLPSDLRFRGKFAKEDFLFEMRGVPVPSAALSDGYRAFLGWVTDLLYQLTQCCPAQMLVTDLPGVVLVDEIDLHLHPNWQRNVIPALSAVFTKLQFVFTTHSPIVAGTVSAENIYVLETRDDGTAIARQLSQTIHGLNADQILLSSYFNLITTRAPGFFDELRSLSHRALSGDRAAADIYLTKLTSGAELSTAVATKRKPERADPPARVRRK